MQNFFYSNEVEQYLFYRMPQVLFTDEKFKKTSCEAKVLYSFLLDRTGLSKKNRWFDKDGRLFVYYTQEEACKKLNIGKDKAVKIFNELEKIELIYRKRQGQGKPIKIYVLNFAKVKNEEGNNNKTSDNNIQNKFQTSEKPKSKPLKSRSLDFEKSEPNHTDKNQTDYNHTYINQSKQENVLDGWTNDKRKAYERYVKKNIGYDFLVNQNRNDENIINLIVEIMVGAYDPQNEFIVIQKQSLAQSVVQQQFEKLDDTHISYVLECLKEEAQKHKIKNLRKYLQTCLYNAPLTIDFHYNNEVAIDMNSKKKDTSYDIKLFESYCDDLLYAEIKQLENQSNS